MQNKTYLFIGISALVHLSVFAIFSQQISDIAPVEHGRSAISVEIIQTKNKITEQINNSDNEKSVARSNINKVNQSPLAVIKNPAKDATTLVKIKHNITQASVREIKASNSAKEQQPAQNSHQKTETDKTKEIDTAQVIAVLQKELSKHFYYPKSAQRKNWQGLVILSFTILANGNIEKINIKQSSGYDVLDSAAINALGEINKQNELAIALNGHAHHQLLPVNYRLTN